MEMIGKYMKWKKMKFVQLKEKGKKENFFKWPKKK